MARGRRHPVEQRQQQQTETVRNQLMRHRVNELKYRGREVRRPMRTWKSSQGMLKRVARDCKIDMVVMTEDAMDSL